VASWNQIIIPKRNFISMFALNDITSRTIAMTGGLIATSGILLAQAIPSDSTMGTSSLLLGSAGLIAAVSAFAKDFWSDRQKKREHEIAKLRVQLKITRNSSALQELYNWAKAARGAVVALPPVPEFVLSDNENEKE
jgi:hypothetical protein